MITLHDDIRETAAEIVALRLSHLEIEARLYEFAERVRHRPLEYPRIRRELGITIQDTPLA